MDNINTTATGMDAQVIQPKDLPANSFLPIVFYSMVFFMVMVLILSANNLRLSIGWDAYNSRQRKFTASALFLSAVLCASLWSYSSFFGMDQSVTDVSLVDTTAEAEVIPRFSGSVIDPWTDAPVADVTLSAGNVSITADQSGRFEFASLPVSANIKLAHPALSQPVYYLPRSDASGLSILFFEPKTINALMATLANEASGDLKSVYDNLPSAVKAKVGEYEFMGNYKKTYDVPEQLSDGITISSVSAVTNFKLDEYSIIIPKAVKIMVTNGKEEAWYLFYDDSDGYKVVQL